MQATDDESGLPAENDDHSARNVFNVDIGQDEEESDTDMFIENYDNEVDEVDEADEVDEGYKEESESMVKNATNDIMNITDDYCTYFINSHGEKVVLALYLGSAHFQCLVVSCFD